MIHKHKSGEYCKNLIEKYYPYFPIWVLVELISVNVNEKVSHVITNF